MKCIANHKIIGLGSFFLFLFLSACQSDPSSQSKEPDILTKSWQGDKLVIYQLLPRTFTNDNPTRKIYGTIQENGCGKFNQITDKALHNIRDLGTTHIWFTGVIEHATMTDYSAYGIALDDPDVVKGRAGSPYAIKDYYDVDPDLAEDVPKRMKEWLALIERTHRAGLRVIIDFVPNHVARSYHSDNKPHGIEDLGASDDTGISFSPNNNFYYLPGQSFVVPAGYTPLDTFDSLPGEDGYFAEEPAKATGNNIFRANPSADDWFETIKLNYGVNYQDAESTHFNPMPDTWVKMHNMLAYWADKGVDGFRCDMAEMVPVEFWNWAIEDLKKTYPDLIFIAEIYNPGRYKDYLDLGQFDYLYDKVGTYDTLRKLTVGASDIQGMSAIHASLEDIDSHLLRFLENHDEQRIASPFFAGYADKAKAAMGISAMLGKGPILIYAGQELGESGSGSEGFSRADGRSSIFDYWGIPSLQAWMNHGAFDGALLDSSQRELRNWYASLLHLAATDPVFASGQTLNLSESLLTEPPDASVFSFARYTDNEVVLCFANFSDQTNMVSLNIPPVILETLQVSTMPETINHEFGSSPFDNDKLLLQIEPWKFDILRLK